MLTVHTLPTDYRWATEYEAENASDLIDFIYVRADFDQVDVAVPANHPYPCQREFDEPGQEHDCKGENCPAMDIVYDMNAPYPDETDYSGWYGGERGYQDGLRWSDFV